MESTEEPSRLSQPFLLAIKPGFTYSAHIFHRLCSVLLCRGGDMGIGAQGKPRREVTRHGGDGFDIHAVLKGEGGEGVPLRYNNDKRKKP